MGWNRRSTNTLRRRLGVLTIGIAALALTLGAFLSIAGAEEITEPGAAPTGEVAAPPAEPTVAPEEVPPEEATPPAEEAAPPVEEPTPPVEEPTTLPADVADAPAAKKSSTSESSAPALTSAKPTEEVVAEAALNIPLNNATALPGTDCPADGKTYWHFVISPNNNHSAFVTFHLNLGSFGFLNTSVFVPNGGQLDNVFVEVPAGATLTSLVKTGSTADINWDGIGNAPDKFQLSHLCTGTQTGSLSVSKVVSGTPGQGEGFPFTITVTCALNGNPVAVSGSPFTFDDAGDSPHSFTGIPAGAICTVEETDTGGADSVLITYQGGGSNVTVIQNGTVTAQVTNVFDEEGTGSLQISKAVLGTPVSPDGYPFTVHVECTDDDNDPYDLTFTTQAPGPQTITGIPDESICTITESDDGGAVDVQISDDEVTIVEGQTQQVTVTNTFTLLQVAKTVENPPATDTEFTIHVTCTEGGNTSIDEDVVFTSHSDGTVDPPLESFTGIPLGSVCTVVEPNPPAGVTPIYDPAGADDPGVTVDANALTVGVTVTNSFPNPEVVGSVSVTKVIGEGAQPPASSKFEVHVECTDGTEATLTFKPNDLGPKQVPVSIPEGSGTTCTVEETNVGANVNVSYDPPDAATSGFLLTVNSPAKDVTITNSFTELEPAVEGASVEGSSVLPFTGSTTDTLIRLAAWLLAIGGVALLIARGVRRRRLIG